MKGLWWRNFESIDEIQIIPVEDIEEHEFDFECKCCPNVTLNKMDGRYIVVHNSFDNREEFEIHENSPFHTINQKYDC